MKEIIILCVIFLGALVLSSKEINIPRLDSKPVIDGKLDEKSWTNALHIKSLKPYYPTKPVTQKSEVYLGYDDQCIYIGVVCHESQMSKLKKNITKRDGALWGDDCVEIFLVTGNDTPIKRSYYHLIVNPLGVKYDSVISISTKNIRTLNLKWDGAWIAESFIGKDGWMCEIAIPFNILDIGDGEWKLNVCREEKPSSELSVTHGKFHAPNEFAVLKGMELDLSKYSVVVDDLIFQSIGFGENSFIARLRNKHSSNIAIIAETKVFDSSKKEISFNRKKIVIPGNKTIDVQSSFGLSEVNSKYLLHFSLIDPKRDYLFSQMSKHLEIGSVFEVDLTSHHFYLAEKKLIALLKMNMGSDTLENSLLEIKVRKFGDKNDFYERSIELQNAKTSVEIPVGDLKPGKYAVSFDIKSKSGKSISKKHSVFEKMIGPFESH